MKEHVLCHFSERISKKSSPCAVYDFLSQISYYDGDRTRRIIDGPLGTKDSSSVETSSVETSDKDYYIGRTPNTVMTENIEQSDADNLYLCGSTIETRGTETSDADNLWKMLSTLTTFSTENTDTDNCH